MTVDTYATLCAELGSEQNRAAVAAVYAKYGVADAECMYRLDCLWQGRFARNPKLLDRWQRAYRSAKRM